MRNYKQELLKVKHKEFKIHKLNHLRLKQTKNKFESKSKIELKQLAKDISKGLIYTNRHIDNIKELTSIFPILKSINPETLPLAEDIGMIYEYYSESISKCTLPLFKSARFLNKKDSEIVWDYYKVL